MKVLILGGTGAIGKHLVELLASAGYEVCVTSRRSRVSEGNIEYLQGDAHDLGFLNSILKQDWDAIVDFMIYSEASFAMRVERLLDATYPVFIPEFGESLCRFKTTNQRNISSLVGRVE